MYVEFNQINANFCEPLPRSLQNLDLNGRIEHLCVKDNNVIHKATVLYGTFSLKERVQTFETYKSQFESACSTKERAKRAIFAIFVTAVVVAIAAVVVFGGLPLEGALIVGLLGGGLFAGTAGVYLLHLIRDGEFNGTSGDGVVGAICLPFLLVYYLARHEPNRAKRMEDSKTEALEIADYILAKKDAINGWLDARKKELCERLNQINIHVPVQNPQVDHLKKMGAEIKGIVETLEKLQNYSQNLDKSYQAALELRAKFLAE